MKYIFAVKNRMSLQNPNEIPAEENLRGREKRITLF